MIFATLGTHHQPFARFLELLAPFADETVVQYGHNPAPTGFHRAEAFMSFADVLAAVDEASAVVTHAGVGSILVTREAGHLPIVVPRLHRLGEHVDDHQVELTTALESTGDVVAICEGMTLAPVLDALPARGAGRVRQTDSALARAVADALDGVSEPRE